MVKNNLTNFVKYGVISYALSFCRFWCLSSVTQAMWVAQNLKAKTKIQVKMDQLILPPLLKWILSEISGHPQKQMLM